MVITRKGNQRIHQPFNDVVIKLKETFYGWLKYPFPLQHYRTKNFAVYSLANVAILEIPPKLINCPIPINDTSFSPPYLRQLITIIIFERNANHFFAPSGFRAKIKHRSLIDRTVSTCCGVPGASSRRTTQMGFQLPDDGCSPLTLEILSSPSYLCTGSSAMCKSRAFRDKWLGNFRCVSAR